MRQRIHLSRQHQLYCFSQGLVPAVALLAGLFFCSAPLWAASKPIPVRGDALSSSESIPNNDEFVEGNNGVLHVYGVLTESACRLDMASANQTVEMGEIGTGGLLAVGAEGSPVAVHLKLRDCLRAAANNLEETSGNRVWSESQPAVSITFLAKQDIYDRKMIGVKGTSGLALRLRDKDQQLVQLGRRSKPIMLNQGNDVLTYWITPVRTPAPLLAGAYAAHIDFRLSYD